MTSSPRQTKPKACRGHFWWPRLLCGSAGANISAARTVGPRGSSALNIRGRNTRTAPDVHVGTVRDTRPDCPTAAHTHCMAAGTQKRGAHAHREGRA